MVYRFIFQSLAVVICLITVVNSTGGHVLQKRSMSKDGEDNNDSEGSGMGPKGKGVPSQYTKPFTEWSNKGMEKAMERMARMWDAKKAEGDEIGREGAQTRVKGISYNKQVEDMNQRAIMKALGDVSSATVDMEKMMGGGAAGDGGDDGGSGSSSGSSPGEESPKIRKTGRRIGLQKEDDTGSNSKKESGSGSGNGWGSGKGSSNSNPWGDEGGSPSKRKQDSDTWGESSRGKKSGSSSFGSDTPRPVRFGRRLGEEKGKIKELKEARSLTKDDDPTTTVKPSG